MTLDEALNHIGEAVAYRAAGQPAEDGVITSVGTRFAYVRYEGQQHAKATDPGRLTLTTEAERRHPADVVDPESGKVRVMSRQCPTCIFWPGDLMQLGAERFEEIVRRNVDAGALLTCHSTLPYGDHPEFGPAVCAGFWARHGMKTAAGRIAKFMLGIVRVAPPGEEVPRG